MASSDQSSLDSNTSYDESTSSSGKDIAELNRIARAETQQMHELDVLRKKFGGNKYYRVINNTNKHILCGNIFIEPEKNLTILEWCNIPHRTNHKRDELGTRIVVHVEKYSHKHKHIIQIPIGYNVVTISMAENGHLRKDFAFDSKLFAKKTYLKTSCCNHTSAANTHFPAS